ncbi:hypothetical protein KAURM247S_00425 [Kitasatospora aureofaciens]
MRGYERASSSKFVAREALRTKRSPKAIGSGR